MLTAVHLRLDAQKVEQLGQLALALRTGRDEEPHRGMGLHRIAQLNDIDAAGGVASFCELLSTDVEAMQIMALEMVANLIALENAAGNERSAGEAVAQSGACTQLVKLMGSRVLNLQQGKSMRPEVERKALRVVFHICKSTACQNALRRAGGASRLLELLATDSPAELETRVEAARCLSRFVSNNPENIADLAANNGVAHLCGLLGDFIEMESSTRMGVPGLASGLYGDGFPRVESHDAAIEAILQTIWECIYVFDAGPSFSQTTRAVAQIPANSIRCFVSVLQNGDDHMNRDLASRVLTKAAHEPSLVAIMAGETAFIKELMLMLDSDEDYTIASEILHGLCSTPPNVTGSDDPENSKREAHSELLRAIFDLEVFDLVLKKLNACVIGEDQFVGEIRFQEKLLGITKSFSAESAEYADYICSHGGVRTLSAFLLSKRKEPLVPVCAQTLMNLCEFNPAIFEELYDQKTSDFFHRMLQTPPDEKRLSALRYFQSLLANGRCIPVGVLDTLFLLASGRDSALKVKSLEVIAGLTGVKSVSALLDPLEDPPSPEYAELVLRLKERVVGLAYFPSLMSIATTPGDGEMRANAIKCIRCAIDGGDELVARMLDQEMLRAFWMGMRRSMDTPMDSLSASELAANKAVVQLLYLVLSSPAAQVDSIVAEQVSNLVAVVTEFIVSQPSRLSIGIGVIRLIISHELWKHKFFSLLVDSTTMGLKFMEALMNAIEQSSAAAAESGGESIFDDSINVLTSIVADTTNEGMVNLVISARVHILLLEFLREDASDHVVTSALSLLDTLTQTRRIRLLILEAGPVLKPLVNMYEVTSSTFAEADDERQEIGRQIGKILVHLASDPLEFRKTLYDHRDVLPRVVLGNILSPVDEVASTAEEIVLHLVETDFATCPLWIDLIETVNVQLVFQVLAAAKRPSVQVTAVRKLVDMVFSHPEILENEETGLSAVEKNTLMTLLITFFVDFDPRTSVVGVLALSLLLKNGQTLTPEQMEKVAVDGAVSLVYWIQKGTERHQENAVNILFDGITDPALKLKFFQQLQSPAVQRDGAFILELSLQLLDGDVAVKASGMFKRCSLLVSMLELTDFATLSKECIRTLAEVAEVFLTLVGSQQEPREEKKEEGDEKEAPTALSHAFSISMVRFLTVVVAWPALRSKIMKKGAMEKVVVLFKLHKRSAATQPESKAIADAARALIKTLCIDDIPKLVSLNVIDIMLEFPSGDEAAGQSTDEIAEMLDTMIAIADCGVSGKMALMDTDGVLDNLEQAFVTILGSDADPHDLTELLVTSEDGKKLMLVCRIASLVLDLARRFSYREQILLVPGLWRPIVTLMEWFPSVFENDALPPSAEVTDAFSRVFSGGLPFLEALVISEQELIESTRLAQIGRVFSRTLATFVDGHKSREVFIRACDGLMVFFENPRGRRALGADEVANAEATMKAQGLRCLKAEEFSLDCVLALLELVFVATPVVTATFSDDKELAQRNSWILAVVLHVLFKMNEWSDTLDVTCLLVLLTRCCASLSTRSLLYEHVEYGRVLEVVGELASAAEWKRYRRRAIKLLAMLGEEDSIQEATASADRQQSSAFRGKNSSTTSLSSLSSGTDSPAGRLTIRCFHCRQAVHIAPNVNMLTATCPSCQQSVAETNDAASTALHALPSVNEGAAASSSNISVEVESLEEKKAAENGSLEVSPSSSPKAEGEAAFTCVNCSKVLQIPAGVSSTEVVCPHCMHLAATRKTTRGAIPALSERDESIESGQSTPKSSALASGGMEKRSSSSSLSGIDVRDTKVVSCGHCSKHLIVKNGASAVKCPSCEGISKLSSTTSTFCCAFSLLVVDVHGVLTVILAFPCVRVCVQPKR